MLDCCRCRVNTFHIFHPDCCCKFWLIATNINQIQTLKKTTVIALCIFVTAPYCGCYSAQSTQISMSNCYPKISQKKNVLDCCPEISSLLLITFVPKEASVNIRKSELTPRNFCILNEVIDGVIYTLFPYWLEADLLFFFFKLEPTSYIFIGPTP